ncbi:fungal specific transcription factor, putative [Trichophyton benhamiae CBS 112371]|uniref:Fungal specific transcription factor, putative n=1 Tax=Arthroderma benhamiae (strain ATCC MYA-4681 / CBS 112371) TaxID=663331 RepID=D4ART3_ARTBC|nr:fungal specific transcription factor, putative [Trichophyton benhamiae CBS 112371]EFE33997.1 fungal specific transcription factor, putative [Trichophyton benhamiae CBS 112371]
MSHRMGMVLGLQVESHKFSPAQQYARRVVWWATAWQDSHFSLSYDRPSAMAFSHPDIPYHPDSQPGKRSFFETICQLIALTLNIVKSRMLSTGSQVPFSTIQTCRTELKRILADTAPYLRDPLCCVSSNQNIERLGLKLHSSYLTSEICRPSLRPNADLNDATTIALRKDCIAALSRTVEAYVEMYSVNRQAARSWIGLQRAISSAFLLAVVGESKTDPNIWTLLRRLEGVLTERAKEDDISPMSPKAGAESSPTFAASSSNMGSLEGAYDPAAAMAPNKQATDIPTDTETQWAKPLIKSLRALQKLNAALLIHLRQHGVITGSVSGFNPAPIYTQPVTGGVGASVAASTRSGSIPPPTPESSASGDWSFPTLVDRAAEYIDPPLWP